MKTADFKLEMLKIDKIISPFWGAWMTRFENEEKLEALRKPIADYEAWLTRNLNGQNFIGGDSPMYIDMHAVVFAERLALLNNGPW